MTVETNKKTKKRGLNKGIGKLIIMKVLIAILSVFITNAYKSFLESTLNVELADSIGDLILEMSSRLKHGAGDIFCVLKSMKEDKTLAEVCLDDFD